MPDSIFGLDAGFPQFTGKESYGEKLNLVYDYLVQLHESLRYTMQNLDASNFNKTGLLRIGETIREPVNLVLEDMKGNTALLWATAEELATELTNQEGNIARVSATAKELETRMENAEGEISEFTATAEGLSARLEDTEGNTALLWLAVDEFATEMESTDGRVTSLSQTVNGITLSVNNGKTTSSIKLIVGGKEIEQKIEMTGLVTFDSLGKDGTTEIDGSRIKTGEISAVTISGCEWISRDSKGYGVTIKENLQVFHHENLHAAHLYLDEYGTFSISTLSEYDMKIYSDGWLEIESEGAVKLISAENLSIDAAEGIYVGSSNGYATEVNIGNENATVYLRGTVYVNGVQIGT